MGIENERGAGTERPDGGPRSAAGGSWEMALERALERFAELFGEEPALEREFAGSLAAFGEPTSGAERLLADRRHLEWFVCERPSDHLEGVPIEVLREAWEERSEELDEEEPRSTRALAEALLGSVASAFEVAAVEPNGSLLLRDLFGLAEYEVIEPAAAAELVEGDLLVGRVFPVEGDVHRLSPATGCFRDPALVAALRDDAEQIRASRGHVLRMTQSELERLFFQRHRGARVTGGPVQRERARRAAAAGLRDAGLGPARASATVDALCRAARGSAGESVGEILDRLAFETEVDLDAARRVASELWTVERAAAGTPAVPADPSVAPDEDDATPARDAAAALRRFDEGRANGESLERLFRRLEHDLGVSDDDEDEQDEIPDFPGVVGAMVEEYLWDRGREEGPRPGRDDLRELSRWGETIGVFENLGPRDLLEFAGRWLLDESELRGAQRVAALLETLADFCRWCEERHAHELWSGFGPLWERLVVDVPRLAALRDELAPAIAPLSGALRVLEAGASAVSVEDPQGQASALHGVPPALAAGLREGDLVRLAEGPAGARIARTYPGVLEALRPEDEPAR